MKNFKKNKNSLSLRGRSPRQSRNRGFTLIELLVVIAIIGMLAATVLTSLGTARQKGRDARRISDLQNIRLAMELYFDQNNNYPLNLYLTIGQTSLEGTEYLKKVPKDPSDDTMYYYSSFKGSIGSTKCTHYHIGSDLEIQNKSVLDGASNNSLPIAWTATGCAPATNGARAFVIGANVGTSCGNTGITTLYCYDIAN